ncbi:MAG TPA: TetR/AcrR family transcriptional regulator [Dokdonella sp.]|nr:TetR/AcrR family transcriptional regulator [Dokdonella sp.]
MSVTNSSSKGAATREMIIDRAYALACAAGLESLSIGVLAQHSGMSKSGVFAHFGSREDLQAAVLDSAAERFVDHVMASALKVPRGVARLRKIVENWFDWVNHESGGCLLLSAVSEFDDRPGPMRDRVVEQQNRWRSEIAKAVRIARETGELKASVDPGQVAFEIYAIALMVHHDAGLFGYEDARLHGRRAIERLLESCLA